jgi:two-component system nitrate/nitrite response regulator NarL
MSQPPLARPIRVALVDDHPTITWGLERLIAGEAPRLEAVGSAASLQAARELIAVARPDVVLLDLDLDGISATPLIGEFASAGIRFLLFTGQRDNAPLDAAMMAGARGVIAKTERPELILRAIERVQAGEIWLDRSRTGAYVEQLRRRAEKPEPDPFAVLTAREREIVRMAQQHSGESNRALAARLFITESSLRNALSAMYAKLNIGSRLQLHALVGRYSSILQPGGK